MMLLISKAASWPTWVRLLVACLIVVLIAGCIYFLVPARTAASQEKGDPAKGLAAAQQWCSQCHIVTNKQRGPATDATPTFKELAQNKAMTRKRLYGILSNPHGMPTAQLSQADIINIIAYIEQLRSGSK